MQFSHIIYTSVTVLSRVFVKKLVNSLDIKPLMLYNKVITYTGVKTMKKFIALLLASVMLFSLFSCTSDEDDTGPVTPPDENPSDNNNPGNVIVGEAEEETANPADYGLGKYITSVAYRNVIYYIYEDGAVVYDCFCPMLTIEIPETVSYIVPEAKPEEDDGDTEGDGTTEEGGVEGDDNIAVALVAVGDEPEDEECTDCTQGDVPGTQKTATVKVIGKDAFYKVGASEIKLPATVTTIASGAFKNCANLNTLVFPASLTSVGDEAFAFTAFDSVNVRSDISYGSKVYYGCANLSAVTFDDALVSLANGMFASCEKLIAVTFNGALVNIGDEAFSDCYNLKDITFGGSIETIGAKAFSNCKAIEAIVIPNSVISVGNNAYYNCTGATTVSIGDSVERIGRYVFYGCTALDEISIPTSVKSVGDGAFGALNIKSIAIPSRVTEIPAKAFINCTSLENVTFGTITAIGDQAFANTAIKQFTVPETVNVLGTYVFRDCKSLESVTVLGGMKGEREIGPEDNRIKQPTLTLEEGTFSGCDKLSSVILGASLTDIDLLAFEGCTSLASIQFPASLRVIGGGAFKNCSSLKNMNIDKVAIESIGMGAFSNCTSLESVIIPASCTDIVGTADLNSGLFDGCTSLKSAVILGNIPRLGTALFKNCTALENVTLSDTITAIGVQTFMNCTSLKNINLNDNIVEYGRAAFFNCPNITEVTVGKNVTKIEGFALGFLENENVPEGLIKKPLVNPSFTLKGYLGTDFENYIQSYVDMNGEKVAYEALGRVTGIVDQIYADYDYEIIEDAVVVGQQTVIDEETGEETIVPITKDGIVIKKYNGNDEMVIVPVSLRLDDLYIVEIANGAFKDNTTVRVIILPAYLKTIGDEAFAGCTSLKELIFEKTAYELGEDAEEGAIAGELEIGKDILKDSTSAKVYAHKGSYVESIAKDMGWSFSASIPIYEPSKPETPVEPETPEGGENTETPAA